MVNYMLKQAVPNNNKTFYTSIDGLRALCFIIVFFFHYGVKGFELGWSGVTVFFVISGFLITEILINTKDKKNYFKNFYIRRFLRIMPVYLLVLIGSTLFYVIIRKTPFPSDFFYLLTYTQNILWVVTDYLSPSVTFMAHTWSLAIEEQFYLLWPLLIYWVPNKHIPTLSVTLILLGIGFRVFTVLIGSSEYTSSILLFSQIDTLAIGGLLACYKLRLLKGRFWELIFKNAIYFGIAGVLLIVYLLSINNNVDYVSAYSLFREPKSYLNNIYTSNIYRMIGFISVGLIYLSINQKYIFINTILSNKVLTHLGKISYGLYLYHWPIFVLLRGKIHNKFYFVIIGFIITYLVAFLSFNFFEKKFNSLKKKFEYL